MGSCFGRYCVCTKLGKCIRSTDIENILERVATSQPEPGEGTQKLLARSASQPPALLACLQYQKFTTQVFSNLAWSLITNSKEGFFTTITPSRAGKQECLLEFYHDSNTGCARLQCYGNAPPPGIRIKLKTKNRYLLNTILGFPWGPTGTGKKDMRAISTCTSQPFSLTYTLPLESTKRCTLEILSSFFVYSNLVR